MTTYNGEQYLREQLDSIYSQTLQPDEVIVVDDCSSDLTPQILKEYHQKKGLIYFINETNLGINKNFEKAVSFCSGNYIAFSDQDDVWFKNKLEKSFSKLLEIEGDEPSLVSCNNVLVDYALRIINNKKRSMDKDQENFSKTLLGHYSQGCTLIINKKLKDYIIPFPEDNKLVYDLYIGLTSAMIGNKYYIAEPLMYYRSHFNNALANGTKVNPRMSQRFKTKFNNRFPDLLPNERFQLMKYVNERFRAYFKKERIPLFDKLLSIFESKNIYNALKIIYSINEISFKNKIIITIKVHISFLFSKQNHLI